VSLIDVLPWATTVMGASIMYLAGRSRTRQLAWALGILNQVVWISYAIAAHAYGFIAGSLLYGAVYARNLTRGGN
jgi:hypothetical protein